MFICKGSAQELKDKLLCINGVADSTESMKYHHEWGDTQISLIQVAENKIPSNIRDYLDKSRSEDYLMIRGSDLDHEYVVGELSIYSLASFPLNSYLFLELMRIINMNEFVFCNFNSIKDIDYFGSFYKITRSDNSFKFDHYSVDADMYEWRDFSKVNEKLGYPVTQGWEFIREKYMGGGIHDFCVECKTDLSYSYKYMGLMR